MTHQAELSETGARVISLHPKRRFSWAISGGKGGVGKSSLAANIAAHLAQRGRTTALVDADFGMADLNLMLGVAPD